MIGNLNSQLDIPTIPSEIFRLAVNNFDSNNFYIRIGSNLNKIIKGINFKKIQLKPWAQLIHSSLPFITYFQYLEKLTDKTALDSIKYRIEWKYALHLPVVIPVIRNTILCEYRRFLLESDKRLKEYQRLIYRLETLLPQEMDRENDAAQILQDVCEFNQKDMAVTFMNNALLILKQNHPKWLKKHDNPRLYARYLPAGSQYDVLLPHNVSQIQINDVLNDIDFLIKEVEISGPIEIKNLIEIKALSQIASQIRNKKANKPTTLNCDMFIAVLDKK